MKLPVASHTFLDCYERCPKQAWHRYVVKDQPYVESEAQKYGNTVHDLLDKRVGKKVPLPADYAFLEKFAASFDVYSDVWTECKFGMNAQGGPVGFFDPDVWMRGKADVIVFSPDLTTAILADWKTGKKYEKPQELEEHALLARACFAKNSKYKTVTKFIGFYVWLKDGEVGQMHDLSDVGKTFARVKKTMQQVEQTMAAGADWPARENPLCGWCSVRTCLYNPERE